MSYKFLSNLTVINSTFSPYNSGGTANDSLKVSSSNLGASFGVQNTNASGYAGIEYIDNSGSVKVFTGFNNSNGQEFRFNNIATGGYIDFLIGGTTGLKLFNNRNVTINSSTDAGYKLYVNGSGTFVGELRLTGNLATGGNRNYILGSSADFEVTTNTVVKFRNYYNSGDVYFLLDYSNGGRATFSGAGATGYRLATSGPVTASSALAQGVSISNSLVAAANNDVLVGLDITPTFTNGAFTGLTNLALRVNGYTRLIGSDAAGGRMIDVKNSSNTDCFYVRGYGDAYLWQTLYLGTLNGSSYISSGSLSIYSGVGTGSAFVNFIHNNSNVAFKILSNSVIQMNPSAGNVLIGTTTDAGQRLQITGNQATTLAGSGDAFNITRTGSYDNTQLTTLATITDTTSNANRAKTGLYVNVSGASTNIAIQTVGAIGVGVTPPSNSFASGYFSYLYAGATVNSAANYNLTVRSTVSSYAAGNGGGLSFWGDDRGQAGANTAFAGVRGVKENSTYLNGLGALVFLTQASTSGLSTESTFAEVGRFTSGGNFLIGTTTNSGYKLDVIGDSRIKGSGSTSGTTTFRVENSSGGGAFTILGDGTVNMGFNASLTYNLSARGYGSNGGYGSVGVYLYSQNYGNAAGTAATIAYTGSPAGVTSNGLVIGGGFALQSATYNALVVNQSYTGLGTNTFVGYLFDPTFDATFPAANIISIKTTKGNVLLATSSGSVGIGTTSPSYKLDVNGTARATTVITDTITTSGSTTLAGYSGGTYTYGPLTANQGTYTLTFGAYNILYGNITSGYLPKANTIGMSDSAIYNSGPGNILIGSTSDNGQKLQVTGNVTVSNTIITNAINVYTDASVNTNETGSNLLVYADITSGPDNLYSGGQVKANIYTSSYANPTIINTSTTVALMKWYPTATQGVMIDYVFYIDGGIEMRSGTFTAVNDNSGNAQYVDNATPDLNGSTSTVTFAAVNNGGTMEFQVTNTSGSPVYMNILTRYIPTLF